MTLNPHPNREHDTIKYLLRNGFRCYTEPRVFSHPDAFMVFLPYFEALEPVSSDRSVWMLLMNISEGITSLDAPEIALHRATGGYPVHRVSQPLWFVQLEPSMCVVLFHVKSCLCV